MTHNFNQIPKAEIQRSSFDLSHSHKTTFDGGLLVPIFVSEALPGDTWNVSMTAFARLATPIKPFFDNLYMETFFFSVPVRQVWENWEKFNGEQINPGDSTDFVIPQVLAAGGSGFTYGTLGDYFGLPTGTPLDVNALHFRAYNKIFNFWFRDENLVTSVEENIDDGPDSGADYSVLRRRKRADYFTSALPWAQKSDPVTIPLGTSAPVVPADVLANGDYPTFTDDNRVVGEPLVSNLANVELKNTLGAAQDPLRWLQTGLETDLTSATAVTINVLREAFQIQRLYERDARGGTRYPEILKSHFGISDPALLVLQRPEYLGGGSSPVNISPVQQTQRTDTTTPDETPQGNLAAYGTATLRNHGFTKSFTEHTLLIGIVNVRADLTYQQGVERMWSRQTRFDYYWGALSHLGEQAILNKEIYWQNNAADDDVFGYQERFAEYRYINSKITGKFRSTNAESLDIWHLSQEFTALPTLGQTFIEDNPPIDRVVAVTDEPQFLFDSFFKIRCARPLPMYGTPGMIDHF